MSSSRWRRFAFFDRSSLNLPEDDVLQELLPSPNVSSSKGGLKETPNSASGFSALPPLEELYTPEELASESPSSASGFFSISCTTASRDSYEPPTPSTATSAPSSSQTSINLSTKYNLSSFAPPTVSLTSLASSCAPLTGKYLPNSPTPSYSKPSFPLDDGVNPPPLRDPCVLVFVSSRNTPKVFCVDVSMRCNPVEGGDGEGRARDLEDYDGYRGYVVPFPRAERKEADSERARIVADHLGTADVEGTGGRIVGLSSARTIRGNVHLGVISDDEGTSGVAVCVNPHSTLCTSSRDERESVIYRASSNFDHVYRGKPRCVSLDKAGYVAVGTHLGMVVLYHYDTGIAASGKKDSKEVLPPHRRYKLSVLMEIPCPSSQPGADAFLVSSVLLSFGSKQEVEHACFVGYKRKKPSAQSESNSSPGTSSRKPLGICCYDLGNIKKTSQNSSSRNTFAARFDLDTRESDPTNAGGMSTADLDAPSGNLVVCRGDGLYIYTSKKRGGVAPIDGSKIVMCCVPPNFSQNEIDAGRMGSYALVASRDEKSNRDAVDVYDTANKLVAFHALLSPSHCALGAAATVTDPPDGPGRSIALVFTSGGSILTLVEKTAALKVDLLLQKNLYSAAISLSSCDPSVAHNDIALLYKKHAEFLYRKGDFAGAMDQLKLTVGMGIVEPSHVIYRYLDAPKIPLLVTYLETLRTKHMAKDEHLSLLGACYSKLNQTQKAAEVREEREWREGNAGLEANRSHANRMREFPNDPIEALRIICAFDASGAADALVVHGATLARALPRETAGIVMSLCDGTYSPSNLAKVNHNHVDRLGGACDTYPVTLFSSAFLEHPKLLRLILAHCRKGKLGGSLRRTLLELTLEEWREARVAGDAQCERLRCNEAQVLLTDSHSQEIGDYEALVIVQLAGFTEGEILLYERLQITPMLLERYAKDGGERARRQMLAVCRTHPELLANVLGEFVQLAGECCEGQSGVSEDQSEYSESEAILEDIQEALDMAKVQGVLPPVQITRILAGEGTGQFSTEEFQDNSSHAGHGGVSVPLSVALDYVGGILDQSSKKIAELKEEIEEFNQSCDEMEHEIDHLLASSSNAPSPLEESKNYAISATDIETMYQKMMDYTESIENTADGSQTLAAKEEFWREMEHSEDRWTTIARFFGKGIIP